MMRVSRQLASFDKVRFGGPGKLEIIQCDQESLSITAPVYILENVSSDVEDGELRLGYRNTQVINLFAHREEISYELRLKDLKQLVFSGSGKINIPDLDNDQLKIISSGSGSINMDQLTADELRINISGSGDLNISGDVEQQTISSTGSGCYISENLISDFAHVVSSGSGAVKISVSEELSVKISGSGQVSYSGFPDIDKLISGSGSLKRNRINKNQLNRGNNHG